MDGFHGMNSEAWVLARHRLFLLRMANFVHTEEAVESVVGKPMCYICLSDVPPPERFGCACRGSAMRHVHVPCQAGRVGPITSPTRFRYTCTTCDVCKYKLSPELVARTVVDVAQDSGASSELRKALQAEVNGAAQLENGSVASSIVTLTSGFTEAHRLFNVSTSTVLKELALAACIRISEWLAMAHALAGKYRRAEQVMEQLMTRREGQKLLSDAANFLALVTENNKHVIRALRPVSPPVTQRQYKMFVDLGTSPWRTDSYTVALHASNLAACLCMQPGAIFKDIELSALLSNFALEAVTIAFGPQHRDTQLVASNNAVVLWELDRHGVESDGSTRSTRIRTQVRPGYWPGLMKPVITRDAGTCHIPRLGRTVC